MKHISDLFAKYRETLQPPQSSVERVVRQAIITVTKIPVTDAMVTYKVAERAIYLQAPSVIKSEVKRKEKAILTEVEKELGKNKTPLRIS